MRASSLSHLIVAALFLAPAIPSSASAQGMIESPPKKKKKGKKKKGKKKKKKGQNAAVGPFKKKDYPTKELKRPLVLPNGMGEVDANVDFATVGGDVFLSLGPDIHYGVADVVDFGIGTDVLLAPTADWSRSLPIDAHFLAVDTKSVDFAPGIIVPLLFIDGAPFGVTLDAPTRIVVDDKLFFSFGQGAIPLIFSPDFGMAISGNGGVFYQLRKDVVLGADTNVFNLFLAPDAAFSGPWDVLQLGLLGQYSWSQMGDVGARINLTNTWGDAFVFATTAYGTFRF